MINVAIVEDEEQQAQTLAECVGRYGREHGLEFSCVVYANAINFLQNYKGTADIVFMDIRMPHMSGMEAAERLRERDSSVVIIFVTSLMQYAVDGYKVGALDFVIKPVQYGSFALTMRRAVERVAWNEGKRLLVNTPTGAILLDADDIRYVEILKHHLVYHAVGGDYDGYGTLVEVEKQLAGEPFARCNACYLVNLRYVTQIQGYSVYLGEEELRISHPKRKDLAAAFAAYTAGGARR